MLPAIFGENLFDEMFDDMMRPMHSMEKALYGKHARAIMKTDVRETDNSYEVDIDLPGFKTVSYTHLVYITSFIQRVTSAPAAIVIG